MKKIFVIDWILIFVFILSAYSGLELHITGHGNDHDMWHNWAVFHVLSSFLFLIAIIFHIATHWGWYRGAIRNGIGRRSKITLVLSAVFVFVVFTGIFLLGVNGANSNIGHWHYKIGIIVSIISVGHILKRIPVLRKSLKGNRFKVSRTKQELRAK